MVELTSAVQSIVSILKNTSTGIGTTGYEIIDDNSTGATILVSYTMSKEELKAAFGGTQDYDVIITVKSDEIDDDWIGLSTKRQIVPIIIEVNIIDKWSAVDTGNKYITAPLVRYKAVNAIRKFIKANTNAPGGSINVWKLTKIRNVEDTSTKPTLFKAILKTEAWIYYNPTGQGSVYGESSRSGGKEEEQMEEGNFTSWAVYDTVTDADSSDGDLRQTAIVDEDELEVMMLNIYGETIKKYTIAAKSLGAALVSDVDVLNSDGSLTSGLANKVTPYGTYKVFVDNGSSKIYIFKNGTLQQTVTAATLGITSGKVRNVSISPKGTYIIVSGYITARYVQSM